MRRRTFDLLMSTGGLVLTIVLVVAGTLAFVGYGFANGNVEDNLRAQKIFFPASDSAQLDDPRIGPYIEQYAGRQLVTGEQAEAYANHFIAVHIADLGKGTEYAGMTYAELGTVQTGLRTQIAAAEKINDPGLPALQKKLADVTTTRDTVFKGETLRGLLLNAFAFWKVGQIAKLASIAAFGFAAIMALLTGLGFWHLRRVSPGEELLAPPVGLARKTA